MELEIIVRADCERHSFSAGVSISEPFYRAFEPLCTTDDPIGFLAGEISRKDERCEIVTKLRKDAAKEISDALTRVLLKEMARHDTHNGYKPYQEPEG